MTASGRFKKGRVAATLIFLLVALLIYPRVVSKSLAGKPEHVRLVVVEHCKFMVGKRLAGNLEKNSIAQDLALCEAIKLREFSARGGLRHPVMVHVELASGLSLPPEIDDAALNFRLASSNLPVLDGLLGIMTGYWHFNHFVRWSDTTYYSNY